MTALRIEFVFPRFKLLSGAERAILGLAGALETVGHRVRIICHQFDASCRPRLPARVELVCTHARLDWTRHRYMNAVADYGRSFGFGRLLAADADLVVLFGPALPLAALLSTGIRGRARVLYYCWEPPRALYVDRDLVLEQLGWRRVWLGPLMRAYRYVDRWLVHRVDAVCTSSPFAARQVEAAYGRPASVVVLGVDRDRLDAAPSGRSSSPPVVLTVNYLHPRKRVDLVIRAAAACGRRSGSGAASAARWIVVGDGPERGRLEALARQLGVTETVRFAGFVPDEELPRYYATASCYVHACRQESFGLSVIEAAYCGCPVVAVDEGGVQDTVKHGVTGYLVPADPEAIARAVHRVLDAGDGGRALGDAGRARIYDRYRWNAGAEAIVRLAGEPRP